MVMRDDSPKSLYTVRFVREIRRESALITETSPKKARLDNCYVSDPCVMRRKSSDHLKFHAPF